MAEHNETGKEGELIAMNFLQAKGYKILEVNKRFGRAEVDIIAQIGLETVFVEVKTRSSSVFGFPEESIDKKKIDLLGRAAEAFVNENPHISEIRFDLISVIIGLEKQEITHIEDAFLPGAEWF